MNATRSLALALCAVLVFAVPSAGQVAAPPPVPGAPGTEEPPPARIQLGPLGVRPAVILREIGYDSNVLNRTSDEQGDFTATLGGRVDLGARLARVLTSASSYYEYLYFKDFASERGSNRGIDGRADFLLGRLRPHVLAGVRTSHDRPSAEIDARAERTQSTLGAGVGFAAGSHTTLNAAYRRDTGRFGDDETFRGVNLAQELDQRSHSFTFGPSFELTPLTTLSLYGEERRDRFMQSPDRDANSHRYGVTATFNPLALISGQASIGVAAFRPLSSIERDFTGLTAAVSLAYAFKDTTRVAVAFDRDLRHSFLEETPYYVGTGGRATLTQRLFRNIDGQATAGLDRIAYEARLDEPGAPASQRDHVRLVGAGIGIRLGQETRLGLNYDRTTRSSPDPARDYSRARLFATLNYGF